MTESSGCGRVRAFREGTRGLIVLDQPMKRNAMTFEMWGELARAVAELDADEDVRTIQLRGQGRDAFSAGADISEFRERRIDPSDVERYEASVRQAQTALLDAQTPTIAVLRGACSGGGAVIALCCRMRFGDETLRFSIPAARIALVYDLISVSRLVAAVGPALAYDILISARTVTSDEALRIGLVNALVSSGELDSFVEDFTTRVEGSAPLSVQGAWLALRAVEDPTNEQWRRELADLERRAFESDDYREAIDAFLAKRQPRFKGR